MKLVYNTCYGGFGLSKEAVLLGRELSGNPTWGGACLKGDVYPDGQVLMHESGMFAAGYDLKRTDPTLIQVVETLGSEKASGRCAQLEITEVDQGEKYRIDEYDGLESIMTVDDYVWERDRRMKIDSYAEEGNAFNIMSLVRYYLKDNGREDEWPRISEEMMSGSYKDLCNIAEAETNGFLEIIRD